MKFLKGGYSLYPPLALPFDTAGGRQKLKCWNMPGLLRLIQSIPSPKAEPFKRWLARERSGGIGEKEWEKDFYSGEL